MTHYSRPIHSPTGSFPPPHASTHREAQSSSAAAGGLRQLSWDSPVPRNRKHMGAAASLIRGSPPDVFVVITPPVFCLPISHYDEHPGNFGARPLPSVVGFTKKKFPKNIEGGRGGGGNPVQVCSMRRYARYANDKGSCGVLSACQIPLVPTRVAT